MLHKSTRREKTFKSHLPYQQLMGKVANPCKLGIMAVISRISIIFGNGPHEPQCYTLSEFLLPVTATIVVVWY